METDGRNEGGCGRRPIILEGLGISDVLLNRRSLGRDAEGMASAVTIRLIQREEGRQIWRGESPARPQRGCAMA